MVDAVTGWVFTHMIEHTFENDDVDLQLEAGDGGGKCLGDSAP